MTSGERLHMSCASFWSSVNGRTRASGVQHQPAAPWGYLKLVEFLEPWRAWGDRHGGEEAGPGCLRLPVSPSEAEQGHFYPSYLLGL